MKTQNHFGTAHKDEQNETAKRGAHFCLTFASFHATRYTDVESSTTSAAAWPSSAAARSAAPDAQITPSAATASVQSFRLAHGDSGMLSQFK